MTTARDQAREAVQSEIYTHIQDVLHHAADVASDVWEPLLREVRQCPVKFKGVNKGQPYLAVEVPTELWFRIKEALGV